SVCASVLTRTYNAARFVLDIRRPQPGVASTAAYCIPIHLSNGFSMHNRRRFCPCICLIFKCRRSQGFLYESGAAGSERALRVLSNSQMSGFGDEAEILCSTEHYPF